VNVEAILNETIDHPLDLFGGGFLLHDH